jgi:cystathionine gamma-lyase
VFSAPFHLAGPHTEGSPSPDFYGAADSPTWRLLEAAIGELDGGHCVVFPSGMGALATVLRMLTRPGDVIVAPLDGYFTVRQLLAGELSDRVTRLVPTAGEWTEQTVAGATLVLIETPSNPGMAVCDIAAIAALTHAAGGLLAVDNTTATPLGQVPLALGADICLASDSKQLSGHSDIIAGHLSCVDAELAARFRVARRHSGLSPSPFDVWLTHRGIGTLDLRLARQADNAAALVEAMRGHRVVSGLRWPGSPDDPAYPLARKQMRRFNGVFCFELPSQDAVTQFLAGSAIVVPATSFGGLHSTLDRRAQWGDDVGPAFVRFSCGVEDTDDLVADVCAALDAVTSIS